MGEACDSRVGLRGCKNFSAPHIGASQPGPSPTPLLDPELASVTSPRSLRKSGVFFCTVHRFPLATTLLSLRGTPSVKRNHKLVWRASMRPAAGSAATML